MKLYENNAMNLPRLRTDEFFADFESEKRYCGIVSDAVNFVSDVQIKSREHWERFVNQFRMNDADADGGWRGEYWGKMMRGATFVYSLTRDPELYSVLRESVIDMMGTARADESGRISTYARSHEFCHWDLWSRKYVLLGMQYFYEICEDGTLREEIVSSVKKQLDAIIAGIGREEEGKKPITKATHHWRGLNSSSLLEPVVRAYSLTGEKKYLDFAKYIVEEGGTDVANIFELAYENELPLHLYPVTKAYEMTSCFAGLLEYYRVTGEDRYRRSVVNFAERILKEDFTVIGCAGCTHELFDHSTVRQANTTNDPVMQETCVTVTLMGFFYQLNLLTGEAKYADAFERAFYNAYLGSFNTEGELNLQVLKEKPELVPEAMPFDSYSPLTAGTRGLRIGGLKAMADNTYYGCCACIASLGVGLVPKMHVLLSDDGAVMNMYLAGEVNFCLQNGERVVLKTQSEYPKDGNIRITVGLEKSAEFSLSFRNPEWSKQTKITVCGDPCEISEGYVTVKRNFSDGDVIEISLDIRTEIIRPISYGEQTLINKVLWGENRMVATQDVEDPLAKYHIALRRGPVMLAEDELHGYSTQTAITPLTDDDGYAVVSLTECKSYPSNVAVSLALADGGEILLTDYASAGKKWNNGKKIAVWLLAEH